MVTGKEISECSPFLENDIEDIMRDMGINIEVLKESIRWSRLVAEVSEVMNKDPSKRLRDVVVDIACKDGILPIFHDECV